MVQLNGSTIYSLPTSAGTAGQVLTIPTPAATACVWANPTIPTAGNGLIYDSGSYSLSKNISLSHATLTSADDEIKIQLLDENSAVTSLIKSKNAQFNTLSIGSTASNYTLPDSAGASNQILGYDNSGQLGWQQRADAGLAAGSNITISENAIIAVADTPLFGGIKIGTELDNYELPSSRPSDVNTDYILNYGNNSKTAFAKAYEFKTDPSNEVNGLTIVKDVAQRNYSINLNDYVKLKSLKCDSIAVEKKTESTGRITKNIYTLPTPVNLTAGSEDYRLMSLDNKNMTVLEQIDGTLTTTTNIATSSWLKLSTNFTIIDGLLSLVPNLKVTGLTTNTLIANTLATEIKVLSNLLVDGKTHTVKNGNETVTISGNNIKIASATSPNTAVTIKKDSIKLENLSGQVSTNTIITADAINCPTVTANSINVLISGAGTEVFYKLPNKNVPEIKINHGSCLIRKSTDINMPLEFQTIQHTPHQTIFNGVYNTYPRPDGSDTLVKTNMIYSINIFSINNIKTMSFKLSATRVRLIGTDGGYYLSNIQIVRAITLTIDKFSLADVFKPINYGIYTAEPSNMSFLGVIPGFRYDVGGSDPLRCDFGLYMYAVPFSSDFFKLLLCRMDNHTIKQTELYKFGIDPDGFSDDDKYLGNRDTQFTFTYV